MRPRPGTLGTRAIVAGHDKASFRQLWANNSKWRQFRHEICPRIRIAPAPTVNPPAAPLRPGELPRRVRLIRAARWDSAASPEALRGNHGRFQRAALRAIPADGGFFDAA